MKCDRMRPLLVLLFKSSPIIADESSTNLITTPLQKEVPFAVGWVLSADTRLSFCWTVLKVGKDKTLPMLTLFSQTLEI
jgi:hypothetical protein